MAESLSESALEWLMAGDPAIRWQTCRDLVDASPDVVDSERKRVALEGWGAKLLGRQDSDGAWARGLYTPKWTSTTYTMLLLRDLGLPPDNPHARKACQLLLDRGFYKDGGIGYGWGRSETCVTGMVLSILSCFETGDDRLDRIADHILDQQMPDGGWNCRRPFGATHSSVHTTISALEGLRDYERFRGRKVRAFRAAQRRGREFLLKHRLFRSHKTGRVIDPVFLRLAFPPRWHYDILRALDYFQGVGAPRDERLEEAIEVLLKKRRRDGRWKLDHQFPGRVHFELERVGQPSRWNTLRALRVLAWWDQRSAKN